MEAVKIKVIKDWPKPKSICNIEVFLGFANFYRQFIWGFSKIATLLTSMLKIIRLFDKPSLNKNNGSRSASSYNINSKLIFGKNDNNDKVDKFGVSKNCVEYAKKSRKLSKLRKSKSEKTSKS